MALACTRSEYITNGTCFTQPNFTRHQQLAILVYRMAQFVDQQIGGESYSAAPFTLLLTDSNNATCGLSKDQMIAAEIGIWNADIPNGFTPTAFNGSGSAPLTRATAAAAIACLDDFTDDQLEKMRLFLQCSMFQYLGL